jgi:uncharacterized protein (DUF362 family)
MSDNEVDRRQFLKIAAAAAAVGTVSGCSGAKPNLNVELPQDFTAEQLARKRKGRSQVAVIDCPSYDDNIFARIKPYVEKLNLPDLKGKTVVLKPNMVEFREGKPVTTNPAVIKAAIELVRHLGAGSVTVAEGPGHMRDTEYLLAVTGIGAICKEMEVPYVDLNLDDLDKLDNNHGLTKMKYFYLPRTITRADAVISLPKMKTHHWVGMTCTMKNLFGTVPGRKYGWPKNLLHMKGIPHSILDLQYLIKPIMGIVDGITCMEGDGPINGEAKAMGKIIIGNDLAAIDATCARLMKLNPAELGYIRVAGQIVGNIEADMIDQVGSVTNLAAVAQSFKMPITYTHKDLLKQAAQQGS